MRGKMNCLILMFTLVFFSFISISCTASLRNKQLENVAKDWSLVIRASQVIPVYPLTEDLQPGDVLLVKTPVEEQARLYKQKGFLPLDQLLVRLYSKDLLGGYKSNFQDFYNARYGITDAGTLPPAQWQNTENGTQKWSAAPLAAFPTYQFEVRSGTGLNLAIPIQGIPFALGLMNSGKASGTVTISNAHTYGLDNIHLEKQIRDWGVKNRDILRRYEPVDDSGYHFLRVVSRVYVAGNLNISINNDEAFGGEAAAGADRPVNIPSIKDKATAENYAETIKAINDLLQNSLPGGKVKIATASSRTVTLDQQFDRPLVIGYVGFDMPVLKGGRLGAPISTLSQLTETLSLPSAQWNSENLYRLAAISMLNEQLLESVKAGNNNAIKISLSLNRLSNMLPDKYPFVVYFPPVPKQTALTVFQQKGVAVDKKRGFDEVISYLGNARQSRQTIEKYLNNSPQTADEYKKELEIIRSVSMELENKIIREPAFIDAVDFVMFGQTW